MAGRLQLKRREALLLKRAGIATRGRQPLKRTRQEARAVGESKPIKTKAAKIHKPIFQPGEPKFLDQGDCMLRVQLPIRLTNNNGGRSGTFYNSHAFRKECEIQLKAWGLVRVPFDQQVEVTVIRVLGPRERLWDSSSLLRGNWKEIEDSLVAIGWFHDDNAEWIRRTTPEQLTTARDAGPSIIVEIRATK